MEIGDDEVGRKAASFSLEGILRDVLLAFGPIFWLLGLF
jgi:hypothetical protein